MRPRDGNVLGETLVSARTILRLMKICFCLQRTYHPYSKWFGSAFRQLPCSGKLLPLFEETLQAHDYVQREDALCAAYLQVGEMHNALGITEPVKAVIVNYHGRPWRGMNCHEFHRALMVTLEGSPLLKYDFRTLSLGLLADESNIASHPDILSAVGRIALM